jgi:hypothetical protein
MQRFPQIFALMVVFDEKACNSFCAFRGKRLFMGGGAVTWVKRLPRILFGLQ